MKWGDSVHSRIFKLLLPILMVAPAIVIALTLSSSVELTFDLRKPIQGYTSVGNVTSGFLPQTVVELNMQSSNNPIELQKELHDWQLINEDVRGIIMIPDWNLHYPVLFSEDNKKYLRHDINGDYNVEGCIYLDANYGDVLSPMKLIHGHNMKNGSMFAKVPSLLKSETLDTAPVVEYYDELGFKKFKLFSVFSVNAKEESVIISEQVSINDLLTLKQQYIDRSWAPVSEVPDGVEMLMLNTCWYGKTGTEHFLHCIAVTCRIE